MKETIRRRADMVSKDTARSLIDGVFEEGALALGGLVALHPVEDELIWRVIRNMDVLRDRAMRRLDKVAEEPSPQERRHPAIDEFLAHLRGRSAA